MASPPLECPSVCLLAGPPGCLPPHPCTLPHCNGTALGRSGPCSEPQDPNSLTACFPRGVPASLSEVLRSEDRQPQSPSPTPGLQVSALPGWTHPSGRSPIPPGPPPTSAPGGTVSVGSLPGSHCCPDTSPSLVCSLPGQGRSPRSLAAPHPPLAGSRSAEGGQQKAGTSVFLPATLPV